MPPHHSGPLSTIMTRTLMAATEVCDVCEGADEWGM